MPKNFASRSAVLGVTPRRPLTSSLTRWYGTRIASANWRCDRPIGSRNSRNSISPGCVGTRCVGTLIMLPLESVVIDDFDVGRPGVGPAKTNSVTPVDADAVLPPTIGPKGLQPVARRHRQVTERGGRIHLLKLPRRTFPQRPRTRPVGRLRGSTIEDVLSSGTLERSDHRIMIARISCYRHLQLYFVPHNGFAVQQPREAWSVCNGWLGD